MYTHSLLILCIEFYVAYMQKKFAEVAHTI